MSDPLPEAPSPDAPPPTPAPAYPPAPAAPLGAVPPPASPPGTTPPFAAPAPAAPPGGKFPPRRPPLPATPPRRRSMVPWVVLSILIVLGLIFAGFLALVGGFFHLVGSTQVRHNVNEEVLEGAGPDKIAVIEISGVIEDAGEESAFGRRSSLVVRVTRQLRQAADDPRVKAIVLAANTPGGGVTASDILYNEVKKVKAAGKKVLLHMGDVCASGGYYLGAPADFMMASPTTVTGSISVIGYFVDASALFEDKLGVKTTAIKSGAFKDMGSPFRPMRPEERAILQTLVDDMCDRFVDIVAAGRAGHGPLPRDKTAASKTVRALADGRVFTAQQALANGLVDGIGYREDAYEKARQLAGLERATVVRYRQRSGFLQLLSGDLDEQVNVNVGVQIDAGSLARRLTPRLEFRWCPTPP